MKKCISCGREIPDDAKFCGFCGALQPETEDKNTAVSAEAVEEEKKPDEGKDSGADSSETAEVTEQADQPETSSPAEKSKDKTEDHSDAAEETEHQESESSEEENASEPHSDDHSETEEKPSDSVGDKESDDHEIMDAEIVEPVSDQKKPEEKEPAAGEVSENKVTEAETAEKSANEPKESEKSEPDEKKNESVKEDSDQKKRKKPHIHLNQEAVPKVNVSRDDFQALLDLIREPEKKQGINNTTTWIILIFAWIANWIAFGSFAAGFISLLIVMIGLVFINWLTLKDHASFGETVRNSAEVIFVPSLLVFAGGLFIRNIQVGAEVYAFHSVFTTAFIGMFLLMAALILFILIVIRRYEMKPWQMVLILTVILALLDWYLLTRGAIPLIS